MTKLDKEIIAAAEALTIDDLFEACSWLRSDGVDLYDKETKKWFVVIPQMADLAKNEDNEVTENDSLERLLYSVMNVVKDHCREPHMEGDTVHMFFENYKLWKKCFDRDEKIKKEHPSYDQLGLFALHETFVDWLRYDMQDLYEKEKAKFRKPNLKLMTN